MLQKLYQRLSDPVFYRKRFRNLVRPFRRVPPPPDFSLDDLPKNARGLLVVAHPDDELFCSGLLCECARRGFEIETLCLTRGEGGPDNGNPRELLGQIREAEMRASCEALGIRSLRFLDYIDPLGQKFRTFAPAVSIKGLAERLASILEKSRPHFVVTHGSSGEYWHPAHLLVHAAVIRAIRALPKGGVPEALLTMNAWIPNHPLSTFLNRDDPAQLTVDATRHREQRLRAFTCHQSQLGFFAEHADGSHEAFMDRMNPENYRVWTDF